MGFAIIIVIVVIYFLLNSLNMYVNPIMLGFAIGGLFICVLFSRHLQCRILFGNGLSEFNLKDIIEIK